MHPLPPFAAALHCIFALHCILALHCIFALHCILACIYQIDTSDLATSVERSCTLAYQPYAHCEALAKVGFLQLQ